MKGYAARALSEMDATQEQVQKFFNALNWAIDEMTMNNAREEYRLFCKGKISFREK
jgi:hypothetical protein